VVATEVLEYRMVTSGEVPQLADFAIEGMQADRFPLHVARDRAVAVIELVRRGAPHFGLAAVQDGRIVGAIAALASEMLFFERWEAHVVMCRAVVPGTGRRLIAAMRKWADDDMKIRRVHFPIEEGADPRMARLLARYGFDRGQSNALFYKE
jgi:hypothetical protein